ncbi:hypothetical protein QL285_009079 [Trifolium repens]|nr:hypothetical protein QL285_009079 [Trifolium repens]
MLVRLGFGHRWRAWMKTCIFNGKLSVLVNGSPTEQVNIKRGLKQGDPLAPFLFLLVAEGLNALTQSAVSLGYFKAFEVSSEVSVSLLQYADDTLFIGEACVENLWAMKAILRWFELASGLKVNFSKSRLIGVNVPSNFLPVAQNFLHCKLGSLPFTYLGLPVGANPRLSSTWDPVVKSIEKRLFSWKNRYVSLGGRVVLINSILASLPVFFLSFFKMPTKVRMKIVRLQRKFLWGGSSGDKEKISWVSWKDVCRPKEEGGLGVKDLLWFNLALLAKWRWRLLMEHGSLWKRVLGAKYGDVGGHILSLGRGYKLSLWWKDLVGLGVVSGVGGDWVQEVFAKELGNGSGTKFWTDTWIGREPLCSYFPRLFKMALHPESSVKDMGEWVNDIWHWRLVWRRDFWVWEEVLFSKLLEKLALASISRKEDSWSFIGGGVFTVNLKYHFLYDRFSPMSSLVLAPAGSLAKVWRSSSPSKVIVFSWQALLGRLPTRSNLCRRGVVLVGGSTCVFCGLFDEVENHLFASCSWAWLVWLKVFKWFGIVPVLPHSMVSIF